MKNWSKILCISLIAILSLHVINAEAKPKAQKVYIFGVSTNFTDSITYITDIQVINPAYIETKTGFLYDRSIYSQQLQIWIEHFKKQPNTTCTIFFSKKRNSLEKKYIKVRDKNLKDKSTYLKVLDAGEFKFTPIEWTEHENL
ncbi:MAG: hypothetical protein IKU79_00220 [Bacteroidaceae bacterium]|jgi:hypothetical protein|nr:hypothetical protein [Bacteroidaceae bacterium]